ncbi:transcriptional regulator [Altericroceibacterium endophyticum]|nr:YdaS family helix-turn-helix protein [Altericroceibacterium endophyticum]
MTPYEALSWLVQIAGSQSALARALGISQPTVWKWLQSSKRLPAEYVLKAERLYGVSRHDLRPDIYPRDYPPAPEVRWHGLDRRAGMSA